MEKSEKTTTKINQETIAELRDLFNKVIGSLDTASFSKSDAKGKVKPLTDRLIKFREFLSEREETLKLSDISETQKEILHGLTKATPEQISRIKAVLEE